MFQNHRHIRRNIIKQMQPQSLTVKSYPRSIFLSYRVEDKIDEKGYRSK